eukprot:TRINITY_DN2329_c0_g1_i5.p1 TRINITY_DN2329_c0_g1~~TRINITY_DN2329_c0_g1_i5.p1  ORF type:complete len:106 (-),score=15.84 TRINITY_DN2329_c0_g1_i5:113-430(-)
MATAFDFDRATAEEWILLKTGKLPTTTLGWFRAGVAFYNKGKYDKCIECMKKSVQLDSMNYNAYQVMARACIATNRKWCIYFHSPLAQLLTSDTRLSLMNRSLPP